ncbi:MAG: NAD(P)-dependent alcohol dehydrogenase [Anaerolineae bacterium]|nr:NAD(P)-dependent alcohol dehydrogenase [Anaerolineae bacterium]
MKAIVATQYGTPEVLELREVARPTPKANEILVKVYATTVTSGDIRVRSFTVPRSMWLLARLTLGFRKPRKAIPGMVLAGEVEAVGSAVARFKPGDAVYAYDLTHLSAYAEYACVPETSAIALKPSTLSYEEAASLPFGAVTALHFLKKGGVHSGQRVLIYGASGSVGAAAVQVAKHFGAEVTAVCSSTNVRLVKSLGADHVIDYTKADFTQSGKTYDIIFDTVGKTPLWDSLKVLEQDGSYLQAVSGPAILIQMQRAARKTGKTVVGGTANPTSDALASVNELVEAGQLKPVIDRCYPLEQTVEAHRYVDTGRKKGNVVITVQPMKHS